MNEALSSTGKHAAANTGHYNISKVAPLCILPLMVFTFAECASAAGDPAFGVFAGRTASLIHPFTNFALFGTSIYAAYLGLQWRRLRDMGEEIKSLNSKLPQLSTGGMARSPTGELVTSIKKDIARLSLIDVADSTNTVQINSLRSDLRKLEEVADVDAKILDLTATRKALQSMNLKDKHHQAGSVLLGVGVTVAVLGAFNTFMRTGKLFPGPHLYAGMAIVILWAGTV